MAIANLHDTLLTYTTRKAYCEMEILSNQARKANAVAQTADTNSILAASEAEIRARFKKLHEEDPQYEQYTDYTEIPEFEEEMARVTSELQKELDELAAWETQINNKQQQLSTELEEINAYIESFKQMLSSNIQEDFNFGLGG